MLNDPAVQAVIIGAVANAAGAAIALYLWTHQKSDRYLLFWGLAWTTGTVRFLVHLPADSLPVLRMLEGGLLFPLLFFFNALGSYDLLPAKPWRSRHVVVATAGTMLAYGVAAVALGQPIEMGYALASTVFLFGGVCLWRAYRATRLSGHAFASATFFGWSAWFGFGLSMLGADLAKSIFNALFNIPLELSLVVIAFQRRGRQLAESEQTLQKIFETAPAPIVIVRPPGFEIERANAVAFEMLGISPDQGIGRTAVELGLVPDVSARNAVYADVSSGQRVLGRQMTLLRAGRDKRVISVNADRIALDRGDRIIYSFYDLTELRRAEDELRASAEETRQLYVRLANVEDDERRALHAELHDQVGANLAALRLELDVASSLLSRDDGAGAQRHLHSAREVATETIAMARDLMAELRPPALDDYGLVAALRAFAESQSSRLSLPIEVVGGHLSPRPSPLVESTLFRIANEAVINAARHASATGVVVEVGERDGRVILTVADDGVGFDPASPAAGPDHWGLKNMRERARAVGGMLEVASAPGAGTRVRAEAPRAPA